MLKKKAVVLLSGGIDSTTCLAIAIAEFGKANVIALSMGYGQKHVRELESANAVADFYGVRHIIKDISVVLSLSDCTLLRGRDELVHKSYADQLAEMGGEGTVSTYVPFRNGLFLASAAAIALSVKASVIYYGAHADDAAGRAYPDCTPEFEKAMNEAIYEGSGRVLTMEAPLLNLNKSQVVSKGLELKVPYELTWSCYEGGAKACGTCGTCLDRKAAFISNGIVDPIEYI